jgi:ubiquinone/menaquinone biosynthesis C-methylase UbiE/uncharacterized protein YbaR (Trm112 family)
MRHAHFEAFKPLCPVCIKAGRGERRLVIAEIHHAGEDGVQQGILQCSSESCRHEYPVIDGLPVIVPDLRRLLSERGVELLLRTDLDPRLESLVGDAIGPDSWFDATRQMLSTYGWDSYADLDPQEHPQDHAHQGGPTPGAARRCLHQLLALFGPSDPARVLDVGCAAGRTSFELAAAHPGALVLGLDINLALLSLARAAAAGQVSYPRRRIGLVYDRRRFPTRFDTSPRVDFWACDAACLPFTAHTADLTTALNLIDCVPGPTQVFVELARVTRPGGGILLATPYDWSQRVTGVENWLGGHSQRAAHAGSAEAFMEVLLQAHRLRAQALSWPWQTRLHERSSVQYQAHLLAIERLPARAADAIVSTPD